MQPLAAGPGFARALSGVVTDLHLAKLEPDTVRTVAPDLMPLFEAYETRTISIKIPAYRDMSPTYSFIHTSLHSEGKGPVVDAGLTTASS
jgi:hypothetical protein